MRTSFKKLTINKIISEIKLEHDFLTNEIETELRAIAVLLGAYNAYGRRIDIKDYEELKERFTSVLADTKYFLNK